MQLIVVLRDPDDFAFFQSSLITHRRRHALKRQLAHVAGQLGAVDQHPDFGVPKHRTRVEIERADEHFLQVHNHGLGVQAGVRATTEAKR
ncbi:hypothetical protein D3C72_2231650 [compost metagenome]